MIADKVIMINIEGSLHKLYESCMINVSVFNRILIASTTHGLDFRLDPNINVVVSGEDSILRHAQVFKNLGLSIKNYPCVIGITSLIPTLKKSQRDLLIEGINATIFCYFFLYLYLLSRDLSAKNFLIGYQ